MTLDKFYDVLLATKINPNRELFEYILRDLDLITKNSEVLFEEALKVLDWRYEYPSLSFIKGLFFLIHLKIFEMNCEFFQQICQMIACTMIRRTTNS